MGNLKDPINPITGSGLGQAQITPVIFNISGTATTPSISGENDSAGGIAISGNSPKGVGIYGKSNNLAAQFDGKVQVNGDHYCSGTVHAKQDVLLGSDCAEDFDIVTNGEIEPGTVTVLGRDGALQASQSPYDTKVAGVVSGAGDYKPGLILGRTDSPLRRMPIALVGKVYCKVDAQYGPVEIGDLLTTSSTLGHAMRAVDQSKAFGAVLGKALRPLKTGQGLVPILVTLQ